MAKTVNISWQKIVSTVVGAVLIGILGWMGAIIKTSLSDVDDLKGWKIETQTIMNNDLANTLESLDKAILNNTSKMGLMAGDLQRLEILINRLDVLIGRIE